MFVYIRKAVYAGYSCSSPTMRRRTPIENREV